VPSDGRVAVVDRAFDADGMRLEADVAPWGRLSLATALRGRHQAANAEVALATLSVLAERGLALPPRAVIAGFDAVRWPGRLEPCPGTPRLWWDAAHNAEGMETLARAWREDLRLDPPGAIVLAVARDKEADRMLAVLRDFAPDARLIVTQTRSHRALGAAELHARAIAAGWAAEAAGDVAGAAHAALAATPGRVLLAGSLFAVGEAMEALGGAPGEVL